MRAAVFLVLVLSTAGGLIVALPVIGYYATAQYQFANFTYELNGEFDTAAIARLKGVEPDNALASFLLVHPGSARAGSAPTTPGPAGTRATILFAGSLAGSTRTITLSIYSALESDLKPALVLSAVMVVVAFALLFFVRILVKQQRN